MKRYLSQLPGGWTSQKNNQQAILVSYKTSLAGKKLFARHGTLAIKKTTPVQLVSSWLQIKTNLGTGRVVMACKVLGAATARRALGTACRLPSAYARGSWHPTRALARHRNLVGQPLRHPRWYHICSRNNRAS